jgi:hypothetical protein
VRNAQKVEDQATGTAKRDRIHLSPAFVREYTAEILSKFDPDKLRSALTGSESVALFCVEGHPTACHRSLAAEHLMRVFDIKQPVQHLLP